MKKKAKKEFFFQWLKFVILALDSEPQHVLSVCYVWMLPYEVHVRGQQELPAAVDPRNGHVLQKLLHVLRRKLKGAEEEEKLVTPLDKREISRRKKSNKSAHKKCVTFKIKTSLVLTLMMDAISFLITERSRVNLQILRNKTLVLYVSCKARAFTFLCIHANRKTQTGSAAHHKVSAATEHFSRNAAVSTAGVFWIQNIAEDKTMMC